MRSASVRSLLLAALALIWLAGASPALAYYAPLQDVTGPTVVQTTDTTVTVSVHNPATNQDIPYTWTIAGGAAAIAVDQLRNVQGVVAWRVKDLTNNKYQVVWGVHDPRLATQSNPSLGWQVQETWPWLDDETNILALNDGILLFESKFVSGNYTHIMDYFYAYDPTPPEPEEGDWWWGWKGTFHEFISYSGYLTRDHVVKDGVAAFIYESSVWGWDMIYMVYDPRNAQWCSNSETSLLPTPPEITAATVIWTDDAGDQRRGYDYTDQTWKSDIDTLILPHFVFAPLHPKTGQPVWFTDMSLAATSWNWDLGEGVPSASRSLYHTYAQAGNYDVQLNAEGPTGADFYIRTVPVVKGPSASAPLMLLLGN